MKKVVFVFVFILAMNLQGEVDPLNTPPLTNVEAMAAMNDFRHLQKEIDKGGKATPMALFFSLLHDNLEMTTYLLSKQVSPNAIVRDLPLICLPVMRNQVGMVRLLVRSKVLVNVSCGKITPYSLAFLFGYKEIGELLKQSKAIIPKGQEVIYTGTEKELRDGR